jgi:hypothetical protein
VARFSPETASGEGSHRTRGRGKRGGGDVVLGRTIVREDKRGKKRRGRGNDRAPFIGDAVGVVDGPQAVPRVGARGESGVACSGSAVALAGGACKAPCDRCRNRGGRGLTVGPHYSPRRRWFEFISNSNEFKLLQNLLNFD